MKSYPYISVQIANFMLVKFAKKLSAILERDPEIFIANEMTRSMVNEYSSVLCVRLIQHYF